MPTSDTIGSVSNDDGEGNENVKKTNRRNNQNNISVRALHFLVHFFAVTARLGRVFPFRTFYGGRKHTTTNFSFSF